MFALGSTWGRCRSARWACSPRVTMPRAIRSRRSATSSRSIPTPAIWLTGARRSSRSVSTTSVFVVADGDAGVEARHGGEQDIEVVDNEREDLRAPVSEIAGVGIECHEVADIL